MDDVSESDHLISINDNIFDTNLFFETEGQAIVGGKISHVENQWDMGGLFGKAKIDYQKIIGVSVHEVLHNFGLDDMYDKPAKEQSPNNYMLRYSPNNNQLTREQYITALNADHNKGTNYSYKSDQKWAPSFGTSQWSPYQKRTVGSDGKIPKVIK